MGSAPRESERVEGVVVMVRIALDGANGHQKAGLFICPFVLEDLLNLSILLL